MCECVCARTQEGGMVSLPVADSTDLALTSSLTQASAHPHTLFLKENLVRLRPDFHFGISSDEFRNPFLLSTAESREEDE